MYVCFQSWFRISRSCRLASLPANLFAQSLTDQPRFLRIDAFQIDNDCTVHDVNQNRRISSGESIRHSGRIEALGDWADTEAVDGLLFKRFLHREEHRSYLKRGDIFDVLRDRLRATRVLSVPRVMIRFNPLLKCGNDADYQLTVELRWSSDRQVLAGFKTSEVKAGNCCNHVSAPVYHATNVGAPKVFCRQDREVGPLGREALHQFNRIVEEGRINDNGHATF